MPAQSPLLTDPADWHFPAVPPDWISRIRWETPAYDPARTPTSGIGVVAELFRTWPGVARSAHPVCSFTAFGPAAAAILDPHALDDPFGEVSPLARLYRMAATNILLLGAPWSACTAFHLAERRADPAAAPLPNWSPILVEGERRLVSWLEYPHYTAPFPIIGQALETERPTILGAVGQARCRYVSLRVAIDVATRELKRLAAG
jgi:aminoglycoside 3-N-acetyltransferase